MAWPKGKPRPTGAGKPKGYKAPATLDKIAAREAARVRITQRVNEIIDAQVDSAVGIVHMMVRDPETGQWVRVTSASKIAEALNHPKAKDGSTYWIYTKDPNPASARDMLAYALDKPKEQAQDVNVTHTEAHVATLLEARQRAARSRKE